MVETTFDQITTIINSVGFPIVTCGALLWFIRTSLFKVVATLDTFKDAISANTNSINILITKLDRVIYDNSQK